MRDLLDHMYKKCIMRLAKLFNIIATTNTKIYPNK